MFGVCETKIHKKINGINVPIHEDHLTYVKHYDGRYNLVCNECFAVWRAESIALRKEDEMRQIQREIAQKKQRIDL